MIASGWRGELLRMALSKGRWDTEEKGCPEQTVEREPLDVSEQGHHQQPHGWTSAAGTSGSRNGSLGRVPKRTRDL